MLKNWFLHTGRGLGISRYSLLYVYCCNIAKYKINKPMVIRYL